MLKSVINGDFKVQQSENKLIRFFIVFWANKCDIINVIKQMEISLFKLSVKIPLRIPSTWQGIHSQVKCMWAWLCWCQHVEPHERTEMNKQTDKNLAVIPSGPAVFYFFFFPPCVSPFLPWVSLLYAPVNWDLARRSQAATTRVNSISPHEENAAKTRIIEPSHFETSH